jgi:hypothetical protein
MEKNHFSSQDHELNSPFPLHKINTTKTTMSIIERARASGKYPPSLLQDDSKGDDEFEGAVMKILDANGTSVRRSNPCCCVLETCATLSKIDSHPSSLTLWLLDLPELCLTTGPEVAEDFKMLLQVGQA